MGRTAKHNWEKLYLEFCQGRYKNVAEFARAKGLHPVAVRREFGKLKNGSDDPPETQQNATKKCNKTQRKNGPQKETKQNPHPWEKLKKQFTDWPEDKLRAYVVQIEARLAELNAVPYEELPAEEKKELGRLRRERRAILSDPDPEKVCKAVRNGKKCRNLAERGRDVCWNHGGAPGTGAQPGSRNALKHGFYSRIFPEDEETRAIIEEIDLKSPLDILWDQIVIQYTAIARAQRIMFVTEKQEMIKELKKRKSELGSNPRYDPNDPDSKPLEEVFLEEEWEFQFSWDRQATFLTAQSKAMKTLEGLIQRYEAMATDEQKVKVEKMKHDMQIATDRLALEKAKLEAGELGNGNSWADLVAGDDEDDTEES